MQGVEVESSVKLGDGRNCICESPGKKEPAAGGGLVRRLQSKRKSCGKQAESVKQKFGKEV